MSKSMNVVVFGLKSTVQLSIIAGLGFLGYQMYVGPHSLQKQSQEKNNLQQQIVALSAQNIALIKQVQSVSAQSNSLQAQIRNLNPTQTQLVLVQINSLIANANQSLLIYHDFNGAIKSLQYTEDLLSSSNDPVFVAIKQAVATDMANIVASNKYDSVMLVSLLDQLLDATKQIKIAQDTLVVDAVQKTWTEKFIANLKTTLFSLVRVNKIGASKSIDEKDIITRELKIDALNAKNALMLNDQDLWDVSIADMTAVMSDNFDVNDPNVIKVNSLIEQLKAKKIDAISANLDNTLHVLSELNRIAK